MYPNPQDAVPLPPHPDLEQYRKRAKELVKASRAGWTFSRRPGSWLWAPRTKASTPGVSPLTGRSGLRFVVPGAEAIHGTEAFP